MLADRGVFFKTHPWMAPRIHFPRKGRITQFTHIYVYLLHEMQIDLYIYFLCSAKYCTSSNEMKIASVELNVCFYPITITSDDFYENYIETSKLTSWEF